MPRNFIAQGETIQSLQNLTATMAANSEEIPHLETSRAQLDALLGQMGPLITLQADFAAQRQEASKKLAELLTAARRLGSFLRAGLKQHYGPRSEKLAAFKLLPFRGRKAAKPGELAKPSVHAPTNPEAQTP